MSKTILITGGTGLLGNHLSQLFVEKNYKVIHLSRKRNLNAQFPAYQWNVAKGEIDEEAVTQADYIIHLAGANVAEKRWTAARKKIIIESRTKTADLLFQTLQKTGHKPKAFISAGGISYYGDSGAKRIDENAPKGVGFLADVSEYWEEAVKPFSNLDIRTTQFRIGVVLSTKDGALAKMLPSYQFRIGSYFGNGKQYYSWIHIDDLAKMFIHAIEKETVSGIYNAVSPQAIPLKTLAENIATALDKPSLIMPVPKFALQIPLGELSDLLMWSNNISSAKIESTGFQFQFPEATRAVKDLVKRKL